MATLFDASRDATQGQLRRSETNTRMYEQRGQTENSLYRENGVVGSKEPGQLPTHIPKTVRIEAAARENN
jgi:hypothetical protein